MSKRKQTKTKTLEHFFSKRKPLEDELNEAGPSSATNYSINKNNEPASLSVIDDTCDLDEGNAILTGKNNSVDVALYVNSNKNISDLEKYNILKYAMVPDSEEAFVYPYSVHKKNNKEIKCYLSKKHFDTFNWLTYSHKLQGLFCKYCVVFSKFGGIHKSTSLNKFVKTPLDKYSKLFGKDGDLIIHNQNNYHKEALHSAANFIKIYENPTSDIRNMLDTDRKQRVQENRQRLTPIIESIIFLGRQNIPLRGNRDSGKLNLEEISNDDENNSIVNNEGNFRELLRFRIASGDSLLKKHMETANANATYISSVTQNQIIECCGEEILENILLKVKNNRFYSILFDETTDISHMSQMSIIIRYVHENSVFEDFVGFIDCHKDNYDDITLEPVITGKVLAETVLKFLIKHNLNLDFCVGIGTDTCNLMVGEHKGAIVELQKKLSNALKCPCSSHSLNLSISKSSNVQTVRNAVGTIKEVVGFFRASAKRNIVLKTKIQGQLKCLCETRWVERHESVLLFKTNIINIVDLLNTISSWKDRETSSKANCLKHAIISTNFIVSLCCLCDILALTINLSKILQTKTIDKQYAVNCIENILRVLKEKRKNSEQYFKNLYKDILEMHETLNIDISIPRLTQKQINRPNIDVKNAEDYYRITVYNPIFENVIEDFKFRFNEDTLNLYELNLFVPSIIITKTSNEINESIKKIQEYLQKFSDESKDLVHLKLKTESELWLTKIKNSNSEKVSTDALSAYRDCDEDMFPTIKKCLQILITLPISVASAERSFSSLKRLKSWLRSTMTEERLVGLALLNIHRDIKINVADIITRFANKKSRKLDFVL